MKRISIYKVVILSLFIGLSAGCGSTLLESKKIDYKSAGKLPPLEVPPDLTAPSPNEKYSVGDVDSRGSATYSVYTKERANQPIGNGAILPAQKNAQIVRAGNQRWLVVQGAPEELWPTVKEFWQELGFLINVETPEAGVMETDWAEDRAKIPQDAIRSFLGKLLDSLYSTGERDKFRTRFERGTEPNTTEIYISHRGMQEVFQGSTPGKSIWEPRPPNTELEAEMLRRLMVRLGVEESRAQAQLGSGTLVARAKISQSRNGAHILTMEDSFDRAWRRIGLALDRVGFTVEDRDRSNGTYFVRYVDPEIDNSTADKGLLSKLAFWKSKDHKNLNERYQILVEDENNRTEVSVLDKDGKVDKSETSSKILNLLYEQLK